MIGDKPEVKVLGAIHVTMVELPEDHEADISVQFDYPDGFERTTRVKQAETRLANEMNEQLIDNA